jgi:chromosome segregation ATPase
MHRLENLGTKLDRELIEIVPRRTVVEFPTRQTSANGDSAAAALGMVSEAAESIRRFEEEAAEAINRAHHAAEAVMKKLDIAHTRAEHAEQARLRAEAQVDEVTALAAKMRNELKALQTRLAAKEAELQAKEQRADHAEQRATEAHAAIERIAEAIRTQLPVAAGASAYQQTSSAA